MLAYLRGRSRAARALVLGAACTAGGVLAWGCGPDFVVAGAGAGGGGGVGPNGNACSQSISDPIAWWDGGAQRRRRLRLTNTASQAVDEEATVSASIDAADLVAAGKLDASCHGLHVLYHPPGEEPVEVPRTLSFGDGGDCATATSARVHFKLQRGIEPGARDRDYYLYYDHPDAPAVAPQPVFDLAGATATHVCAFEYDPGCLTGQQPSIAEGALRLRPASWALGFGGDGEGLAFDWPDGALDRGTIEMRVRFATAIQGETGVDIGLMSSDDGNTTEGTFSLAIDGSNGKLRLTIRDPSTTLVESSERANWEAGRWYHLALTWRGDETRLFVDGVEDSVWPRERPFFYEGARITVGSTPDAAMRGAIDELHISRAEVYAEAFDPPTRPLDGDAQSVVLMHFDEGGADPRNGGVPVAAIGEDLGATSDAIYVPGPPGLAVGSQPLASHGGVLVETSQTNAVENPSFDSATWDDGWTALGNLIGEQNTEEHLVRFGDASARLTADDNDDGQLVMDFIGDGFPFTLSAYVRHEDGRPITEAEASLVFAFERRTAANGARYRYVGDGWWRLSYSGTPSDVDPSGFGVEVAAGTTVYVDGVQLERGNLTTSYIDGSLGDGYAWDADCDGTPDGGPAHAACSVRTAVGNQTAVLAFDRDGALQPSGGAVSLWAKPHWRTDDAPVFRRFSLFQGGYGAGWGPGFDFRYSQGQGMEAQVFFNNQTVQVDEDAARDAWMHVVLSWDGTDGTVTMNGTSATSSFDISESMEPWETFWIGGGGGWTDAAMATIGSLRIFDAPLTPSQTTMLYLETMVAPRLDCEEEAF